MLNTSIISLCVEMQTEPEGYTAHTHRKWCGENGPLILPVGI